MAPQTPQLLLLESLVLSPALSHGRLLHFCTWLHAWALKLQLGVCTLGRGAHWRSGHLSLNIKPRRAPTDIRRGWDYMLPLGTVCAQRHRSSRAHIFLCYSHFCNVMPLTADHYCANLPGTHQTLSTMPEKNPIGDYTRNTVNEVCSVRFHIFIKPPMGNSFLIWAQDTDGVVKMKQNISLSYGYPCHLQYLIYSGMSLQDSFSTKDFFIGSISS